MGKENERYLMTEKVELELKILNTMKLIPEGRQADIRDSLMRCVREGINISEKAERDRNLETGSSFLDKFIHDQAFGTCIGSGDDMYYVEQCYEYFKKQVAMWREFEKQVREDVMDEHGILYGEDAKNFIEEMERNNKRAEEIRNGAELTPQEKEMKRLLLKAKKIIDRSDIDGSV